MNFAIVSHDSGGAEILSSYVRQERLKPLFVLEGPARRIFDRKLGPIEVVSLEEAITKTEMILCGTSWQSDLEVRAIEFARTHQKRSIAFLDHWVNYRERFVRRGMVHYPDEIWVGDDVAERIARQRFSDLPVRLVENPYLREVQIEIAALADRRSAEPRRHPSILYICEPVREHGLRRYGNERHFGYVEEEALRFFLSNANALTNPIGHIRVRPHPSEPPDKYAWARSEFDLPIDFGGQRSLVEEIINCDLVVGCESVALVVGLMAGKRVVSCIPPGGKRCGLPHPEIEHWCPTLDNRF